MVVVMLLHSLSLFCYLLSSPFLEKNIMLVGGNPIIVVCGGQSMCKQKLNRTQQLEFHLCVFMPSSLLSVRLFVSSDVSYLSSRYFKKDIVNWRLLFDASCQGVVLSKGDVVEGPGFGGVFAATSAKPGTKGDSSRHGVAGAMAYALGNGPGNVDFGVSTAESRSPPTDMEWALEFSKLN
mmetsp:Transcript_30679/g.61412  ORF Transcript_30679/g.61412 Transcript_30679/m.61412 type:complete len:180 (+) Transcript_30679:785-1324(+)